MPSSNFKANGYTIGPPVNTTIEDGQCPDTIYKGISGGENINFESDTFYPTPGDAVLECGDAVFYGEENGYDASGTARLRAGQGNYLGIKSDFIWNGVSPYWYAVDSAGVSKNRGINIFPSIGSFGSEESGIVPYMQVRVALPDIAADNVTLIPPRAGNIFTLKATGSARTADLFQVTAADSNGTLMAFEFFIHLTSQPITFTHNKSGTLPLSQRKFMCPGGVNLEVQAGDLIRAIDGAAAGGFTGDGLYLYKL